jgi:hypothetical protein
MVILYIYSTCWCMKSMFYERQHHTWHLKSRLAAATRSSSESLVSLSLPPSSQLVVTVTYWGHYFVPLLSPSALLFAPLLAALRGDPRPPLGPAFLLL